MGWVLSVCFISGTSSRGCAQGNGTETQGQPTSNKVRVFALHTNTVLLQHVENMRVEIEQWRQIREKELEDAIIAAKAMVNCSTRGNRM